MKKPTKLEGIKKLQSSTDLLIPRAPFQRLVGETLQKYSKDFRIQSSAVAALQEASEAFIVGVFERQS